MWKTCPYSLQRLADETKHLPTLGCMEGNHKRKDKHKSRGLSYFCGLTVLWVETGHYIIPSVRVLPVLAGCPNLIKWYD
jgi:hypothetical protein